MGEKDYAPLTSHCVRALNDKLYDKRKSAAVEIEKMVRDFQSVNNTSQIKKLLKVLGQDFALSQNPNSRKGGLIGLAAIAIALGQDSALYIDDLVAPILASFMDQDSRIRYYACEALYNIIKVARGAVLPYFNDIFDVLSRLVADPDQSVKQGCELLDRLLKDVVTENPSFDLIGFIPLLRERVYTKNPFARQFIVSWVTVLDSTPHLDMVKFLPEILDGLFGILEDPTMEIKKMCETLLGEFLKSISKKPENVDFCAMVNFLLINAQSSDDLVQFTALIWLNEFLDKAGRQLLPFASGILTAILPHFEHGTHKKMIGETAKAVNTLLKKLIQPEDNESMELSEVVRVLVSNLQQESMPTRLAVLHWLHHLLNHTPSQIFLHIDSIFSALIKTLQDASEEVVMMDLKVLAQIASCPPAVYDDRLDSVTIPEGVTTSTSSYFTKFMVALLHMYATNPTLLEDRGPFIIRELCVYLDAEDIYRTMSEILLHQDNLKFAATMVQTLNSILLTSTELFDLRVRLNKLENEASWSLFTCLYKSWCHSPVATIALCLLSQNYKYACDLLFLFGDVEVTVEFLTEIDKLVQLIESPIFTYLRLQLLEGEKNFYLVKSLYALLMLLPQSEAFNTLQHRLACVPKFAYYKSEEEQGLRQHPPSVDFDQLLEHFKKIQSLHHQSKLPRKSLPPST